jgi:thioredoxin-related protein
MNGQEMGVEAMKEGEINDEAVKEVVMEDMDYAELKNKFVKPKKRVAGETVPELSSEEELMAKFSTVRSHKNQRNR